VLDALGRFDAAREAYLRAFSLDPEAGWALSNLCYLEFRRGRFEHARGFCEAALRAAPTLVEAHNNLGLTYAASGDLSGAQSAFLGAGDPAHAHYNMGIVHLASGRFVEAAAAFAAAVKERPDFTAAKSRAHESRMRALTADDRKQP
jgi:tetratricopeptide (TPR) repeat protein